MREPRLYLDDIWDCITAIEEYSRSVEKDAFLADRKLQDAILRRLEVMGEAVKHLPDEFRERYPDVPWKRLAGLRDILIHEYFGVKMLRVWYMVQTDLPALKRAVQAIRNCD
jgi:uncharacterized protein with HEPN domain